MNTVHVKGMSVYARYCAWDTTCISLYNLTATLEGRTLMTTLRIKSWAIARLMGLRSPTRARERLRTGLRYQVLPCSTTCKGGACVCTSVGAHAHILSGHNLAVIVSFGLLCVGHFLEWKFRIGLEVLLAARPSVTRPCFLRSLPSLIESERGREGYLLWAREL